jgi:hypothetical protein
LLILSTGIPLHTTLAPILFQTKEGYATANFMIGNWNSHSTMLSHYDTRWYIDPQVEDSSSLVDDGFERGFRGLNVETYGTIIYSVGLENNLRKLNVTAEEASQFMLENYDIIYNSGFSYVGTHS